MEDTRRSRPGYLVADSWTSKVPEDNGLISHKQAVYGLVLGLPWRSKYRGLHTHIGVETVQVIGGLASQSYEVVKDVLVKDVPTLFVEPPGVRGGDGRLV